MLNIKRAVHVRNICIGGGARVSIQSMTNTATADSDATLLQIASLEDAHCDIVRLAVRDEADARALRKIRAGTNMPLVADIHFDHRLAILAAENGADKLRINPGNIGGKEKVRALADCAKQHRLPIRIGVNGGSLDKDIIEKYASRTNPDALVESAMRQVRLLEDEGFEDIIISLKTSNVKDTVEAYRKMNEVCDYPLHLGITEAGSGDMALVKSSLGIGALLLDGIGDTIRVSITGDPVDEIAAAKLILRACGLLREGVDVVSCPACGRCQSREIMLATAARVKDEFNNSRKACTVAVMGCAVNGPGEAMDADIGIAFGRDTAVVFCRGEKVYAGEINDVTERFLIDIRTLMEEE